MKKSKLITIMCAGLMLTGCGNASRGNATVMEPSQAQEEENVAVSEEATKEEPEQEKKEETEPEEDKSKDDSASSDSDNSEGFDYEKLGVTEYTYPDEFVLDGDLKTAVEIVASEAEFNKDYVLGEFWKNEFLNEFVYSMYDGPEYERNINKNVGHMTREQVEYMQYSLSGEYISYSDLPEDVDSTQTSYSPMLSYIISDYEYELDGEDVLITANADMSRKSDAGEYKYTLKVRLRPDKYSCFNGYNIVSLEKEEIVQLQQDDGNKHEIKWYCAGDTIPEEGLTVTGEFCNKEDTMEYGMFVNLEVTQEQKQYIVENSPGYFKVTYEFNPEGMPYPIESVVPISIEAIQN